MQQARVFPSRRRMTVVFDKARFPSIQSNLEFGEKGQLLADLIIEGLRFESDPEGNEFINADVLIKNATINNPKKGLI